MSILSMGQKGKEEVNLVGRSARVRARTQGRAARLKAMVRKACGPLAGEGRCGRRVDVDEPAGGVAA